MKKKQKKPPSRPTVEKRSETESVKKHFSANEGTEVIQASRDFEPPTVKNKLRPRGKPTEEQKKGEKQ